MTLEELVNKAEKSWGKQLPQFISLADFETKIKRIAKKYGGDDRIIQEGTSHRKIKIQGRWVHWAPRQKGHEQVLASGTFKDALWKTSIATNIPDMQLDLYFRGGGKPYKRYKREFETHYDI